MTLRYERYPWRTGQEWMFATGPAEAPQVMIVPPLFEEMNFTRAVLAETARGLAARGIGAWIIDLPGTGESAQAIEETAWQDWRDGVAAAARAIAGRAGAAGPPHIASVRGGALIDDAATGRSRWRFAAADGAALLRQMERAQAIGDREAGRATANAAAAHVDLIGYRIARPLIEAMRAATPAAVAGPLRNLPFEGPGAAPWRKAEPAHDRELAAALTGDIAGWIAACDG